MKNAISVWMCQIIAARYRNAISAQYRDYIGDIYNTAWERRGGVVAGGDLRGYYGGFWVKSVMLDTWTISDLGG